MPKTSKWCDMVMQVQSANLQKQVIQSKIKQLRKIKYRQELDHDVQARNKNIIRQNIFKRKERQQIQKLAQIEAKNKLQQKLHKEVNQQNYGYENLKLMRLNEQSRYSQKRKPVQQVTEHPFVKLVDHQDRRNQQLKNKFLKQNEINQLQQKIKQKNRSTLRYQQKKQLQQLIKHEEDVYKNREVQRQKFKSKYMTIKRSQNIFQDMQNPKNTSSSVQKQYVDYLSRQIIFNNKKKIEQKDMIDQKIKSMHGDDSVPDSSPAYLGRNVLSNDRKRQMHYLNKCLGINQKSYTQQKHYFNRQTQKTDVDLINLNNFSATKMERYKTSNPQIDKEVIKYPTIQTKKQSNILFNKSHQISPTARLPIRTFKQTSMKQSLSEIKIQSANHLKQLNNVKQQKKLSTLDNENRRIKSQFSEIKSKNQYNQPNVELKPVKRRQFRQYDVITGKSTFFYA